MREDVHGESRHGHVDFITVGALLGHPAIGAAVGLLVTGQVRRRGVVLAALGTGIARTR